MAADRAVRRPGRRRPLVRKHGKEVHVKDWVKTLLTSSAVAAVVSLLATSYKIEQELHSKQSEAGYEALIQANNLSWRSKALTEEAKRGNNEKLAADARRLRSESDDLYTVARHKIAAFGDERVVKAMSEYYARYGHAATPCPDKGRSRSDTRIYKAIRNTLGVGGSVTDEQLATVIFLCAL